MCFSTKKSKYEVHDEDHGRHVKFQAMLKFKRLPDRVIDKPGSFWHFACYDLFSVAPSNLSIFATSTARLVAEHSQFPESLQLVYLLFQAIRWCAGQELAA